MSILSIRLALSPNSEDGRVYGYLVVYLLGSALFHLLPHRGVASKFHISTEGEEKDLAVTRLEPR